LAPCGAGRARGAFKPRRADRIPGQYRAHTKGPVSPGCVAPQPAGYGWTGSILARLIELDATAFDRVGRCGSKFFVYSQGDPVDATSPMQVRACGQGFQTRRSLARNIDRRGRMRRDARRYPASTTAPEHVAVRSISPSRSASATALLRFETPNRR